MALDCVPAPSPNFDARSKDAPVDILVMHYTGMETGAGAIARLTDPAARVSSHYTVDEDGTVYAHVPEDCRAWHAGVSYWAGAADINARSIGIEIVNPGHEFGYRAFTAAQIEAVIALSLEIFTRHAIPPERVLAHSDVAPARKQDPGELFPWATLANEGIGLWPERPPTRSSFAARAASEDRPPRAGGGEAGLSLSPSPDAGRGGPSAKRDRRTGVGGTFEQMLRRYGYGIRPDVDVSFEDAVTAFQRHFRQNNVDGIADAECEVILSALLALVPEK